MFDDCSSDLLCKNVAQQLIRVNRVVFKVNIRGLRDGGSKKEKGFLILFIGLRSIKEDYFEVVRDIMQRLRVTGEKIPAGIQLVMKIFNNLSADRIIEIDQDISTEDDVLRGEMGILVFVHEVCIGECYKLFHTIINFEFIIISGEVFIQIFIRNILDGPRIINTFLGKCQGSIADVGGKDSDIKTGCIELEICQ